MNVMVIGGGRIQSFVVLEIQKRGYRAIVIDRDRDCWCSKFADEFHACDTHDHQGALDIAQKVGIHAVITAGTDVGYTVAYVAYHMGLKSCHPSAAYSATNKARMRDVINLEHPVWMVTRGMYSDWEDLCERRDIHPYPCVIKPVDLSASRGITVIRNRLGFIQGYYEAQSVSPSNTVIVEEALGYVDGAFSPGRPREVAIDAALIGGKPYIVNAVDRVFSRENPGIEIGHINPAFKGREPESITAILKRATSALGVTDGPFKMDLIHDERYGWCLLECAVRWSGAFDHSYTAKIARDHNYSGDLVDYATTGFFDIELKGLMERPASKAVACMTPVLPVGHLVTDDIIGLYRTAPGVIEVVKMRERQGPLSSCAVRPLFVFAAGDTKEAAWKYLVDADTFRHQWQMAENPKHYGKGGE